MKNNNFAKIFALILSAALLVGACFAISTGAEDSKDTTPYILSQNVAYTGDFGLVYAVSADAVAPVTLKVYDEVPTVASVPVKEYVAEAAIPANDPIYGFPLDAYIFETDGVVAAAMTQNFYIKAVGYDGKESSVVRYSVAEYLYERLADSSITDKQRNLYNKVLEFGDAAQAILTPDATSILNYRYVTVNGGVIDDFTTGVYPIGASLVPKCLNGTVDKWTIVTYDSYGNPLNNQVANGVAFTVTDSVNIVNAGNVLAYRSGTKNFDEFSIGDKLPTYISKGNTATYEFAEDGAHKTVVKYTLPAAGDYVIIAKTSSAISAEEATAVEFSFDFKAELSTYHANANFEIRPQVGSSAQTRIALYVTNSGKTQLYTQHAGDGSSKFTFTGTDTTDYNHIRIVLKKGDTNVYLYVNGSTDPVIFTTTNFDGDITKVSQLRMNSVKDRTVSASVYIDNVYGGYIKE